MGPAPSVEPLGDLAEACAPLLGRCRFPEPGTKVTCAVSGGADSLALLALAVAAGCRPDAVHVDHGLRPGSAAEADVVAAAARRFGATFRTERVHVAPGGNLEARARAARHAVLPDDALYGHTADDQAETVVLNLLRGAGVDGLAGIRADPRHPILALRRHETRSLCERLGLEPVHDPSNDDPRHRRNRVRQEVLPLLDDVAGRDLVPVLGRQAELLREVADLLAAQTDLIDPTDSRLLAAAPPALARVALRRWLRSCDPEGHPPDAATVDRVLAVVRGVAVATDVGGGWRVARTAGRLRLEPPGVGHGGRAH
ncbi:MAG TPA: tRNA lysidine(34) synthetase TilS [Acidimicrobiales bacterium]|nr:tRNA lysidine(34) synthetase TilS [Acidimicrobiales bacterium]